MALKIKKNDLVLIRRGKERGKKGKVLEVIPSAGMVVVDGANKVYRHVKSQQQGQKGQRIEVSGPIYMDNVMVICSGCKKPSKIGYKIEGAGAKAKKIRVCKKCGKNVVTKSKAKK